MTRNEALLRWLPLAKAIALKMHRSMPSCVDRDDLIHEGVLGLYDALQKYDPSKGVRFDTYAAHRIRGAILDSLRKLDWAKRAHRQAIKNGELDELQLVEIHQLIENSPGAEHHLALQEQELPDVESERAQMREVVAGVLEQLPKRWRIVVTLYYRWDLPMKQIGDLLGVNESRISQIHKQAIERLRELLPATSVHQFI